MSEPGLGRLAARGAAVTVAGQVARMALQLVGVVVLARLLAPADFGLVALALVVVGLGELFRDFGLSQASVQATVLSAKQRTNLFWINAAIGLMLTALCLAAGPLLGLLSGEPEVVGICQALSATFLLNSLAAQYRAGLMRQLRFTAIAMLEVCAAAMGLVVAISGGILGIGYWALVAQQLTTVTVTAIALWVLGRWLPGLPNREGEVRSFLSFGFNLMASQIVSYIAAKADTVILGFRYSPEVLGLYNRAYQMVVVPVGQIRGPLTNVALPILSRLKNEVDEFNRFVRRGQLLLGYTLCLPLGLLAVAASPVVEIALGSDWLEAEFFLRCFAVAAMFQTLAFVGYWMYVARGLPHVLFRYSIMTAVIKISCVVLGSAWGPHGVAVGFAVAPALAWPLSLWWLSRHTPTPTRALYAGAGRVLAGVAAGAVPAAVLLSLLPTGPFVALMLGAGGYILGSIALLALPAYRQDARDIVSTARLVGRSRR